MKNVYLIGYRCTGKTTVGRLLAEALGRPFLDSDAEVVRTAGMSIADMVAAHGWTRFRALERETLLRLSRLCDHVVATGGGVILDPANVAAMRASGRVFWLRAAPETILARMGADAATAGQRPSLTGRSDPEPQGLEAEIRDTLAARLPLYEAAAHYVVDTDGLDGVAPVTPQVVYRRLRDLLERAADAVPR